MRLGFAFTIEGEGDKAFLMKDDGFVFEPFVAVLQLRAGEQIYFSEVVAV